MQRKPSSDLTRRQYATITIDPFKSHKTKITAYAEFYNNYANDQNTLLPEDLVTPWLAAGKPMMNPVTGMITDLATGKVLGPYVSSTTSPGWTTGLPTGTGAMTSITSPLFQAGHDRVAKTTSPSCLIQRPVPVGLPAAADARIELRRADPRPGADDAAHGGPGAGPLDVHDRFRPASRFRVSPAPSRALPGGYATYFQPGVVNQTIYNSQNGPNYRRDRLHQLQGADLSRRFAAEHPVQQQVWHAGF